MLTVEVKNKNKDIEEVAICFDKEGLDKLIKHLEELRKKPGHIHLMTPSWAGTELTETKQGGKEYSLVNHLRLVRL
jgi:hypothetical protein